MMDIRYPEIFLAIDNCFASKRYTEPDDWMQVIRDLGISYVEASADTECDPLYQGTEYLRRWIDKVKTASGRTGVSVCNLYSGHGTYSTLGLAHTDPAVRGRMLNEWLKPMSDTAAALGAGLGFFCHAFSNPVLQDPELYREFYGQLVSNLAETSQHAHSAGCRTIGVEQMYSPHQVPWTIGGARQLIRDVHEKSGYPFYLSIDTGHQSGQKNFLLPSKESIIQSMVKYRDSGKPDRIWLGPDPAYRLFDKCREAGTDRLEELADRIISEMNKYPYLFAGSRDGSPYAWLEDLAGYSPIIHLQQTDGNVSAHWPFTEARNKTGIIEGAKILEAIKIAYEKQDGSPVPKVDRIYLTIEVFASTASINYFTIKDLEDTVKYWRRFIPEDGLKLNELI
jgi:sugar phosphate isomerase/epimerase